MLGGDGRVRLEPAGPDGPPDALVEPAEARHVVHFERGGHFQNVPQFVGEERDLLSPLLSRVHREPQPPNAGRASHHRQVRPAVGDAVAQFHHDHHVGLFERVDEAADRRAGARGVVHELRAVVGAGLDAADMRRGGGGGSRGMRAEAPGDQTLQTTALVNEAFVRLVDGARVAWTDRVHFYAVCARLMRRVLIDRARAQRSLRRGGDDRPLAIAEWDGAVPARADELLALDEALRRLAEADPRKGQVVEMRYFAGLSVEETAEALGVSVETVMRDWKVAKTWLLRDLRLTADNRC
jgi:RNA polymerase sigma factor (TIGR02999 family)